MVATRHEISHIEVLGSKPDFLEQKTALEEFLGSKGHVCRMLPKMHPELNPIESFWAAMKVYLREVCDYNVAGLRKNVPDAVKSVKVETVRRHFRRSARFRALYWLEVAAGVPMPFRLRQFMIKSTSGTAVCHNLHLMQLTAICRIGSPCARSGKRG
jgi:hypothetical protein